MLSLSLNDFGHAYRNSTQLGDQRSGSTVPSRLAWIIGISRSALAALTPGTSSLAAMAQLTPYTGSLND